MDQKTNFPDSDRSVRGSHPDSGDENPQDVDTSIPNLQTSNKSGKHSSAEKLAASRPEFGAGRGAQQVSGAFGEDETNAGLAANRFRCESCGRYFTTEQDLSDHEVECRLAKAATANAR
jgi:hypothetical protein